MYTSEVLKVKNHSNATAKFKFKIKPTEKFQVDQSSVEIKSGETKAITIIYTPDSKIKDQIEEFELFLKIEDGDKLKIKCLGYC